MLSARLFGEFRVEMDGRHMPSTSGLRPRSLLAYLLLNPGPHPRARLAGRFWPDVLDTSARASLRSALWAVREALDRVGAGGYLAADRTHVGISGDLPRSVDAEEFDRLAALGDRASLEAAVALARAPLLADLADEWALEAQDAHRDRLVTALERLAALAEGAGDLPAAVRWTRAALEQDRLREATHRDLMRRLDASGERAQALAAYRRLRAVLAAEMGIVPSRETRELAASLRGEDAPAPREPPRPARPAPRRAEPLVGRARESAALDAAWARAAAGLGGVVVVEGPAGIGKSRLVAELARRARAGGGRSALGGALELDGAPPLAPWSEAVREIVRDASPPPEGSWPGDLARLCPSVEPLWGRAPREPSAVPELERVRLFEAVVELVAWCAREAPVVVALEDLHRADPASAALLAHLGRRLGGLPALVVVTRRSAPANVNLDLALDAVRSRGLLRLEISLEGLSEAETGELVGAAAPGLAPEMALRVVAGAQGSPFLAREGARAAAAGREPAEGVRGAIRGPLGRLDPAARSLVNLAAAAGRPLEPAEAGALVGPGQLPDALDAALDAGLLVEDDDRRVRFAHDLIREACYAELTPAHRAEAHRRLGEALGRRPGRRAAEVARHHRLAGEPEAARRYLAAAAQDARTLGALEEAAAYLAEAVSLAGDDPSEAGDLWLALAEVHSWRADRPAMDEAFAQAERLLGGAGDAGRLALAHAFRGRWLHTTLCYPADALASSRRALELIDLAGVVAPEARLLALSSAAWSESVAGDPAEVPRLIEGMRSIPEAMGDRALEAELEHARATALLRAGDLAGAGRVSERAADLARLAGRPDIAALGLLTGAAAAACAGDVEHVLVLCDRLAAFPWPGRALESQLRAARAHALSRLGRHDEAIAAAEETAERAGAGGPREEGLALLDLGEILLAAGSYARAAVRLRAALEVGGDGLPRALARLLLAEALVGAGEPAAAQVEVERVPFEPVGPADMPEALVPRISRVQGLIAAASGEPGLAGRHLDDAERAWRRMAGAPAPGEAYAAILVDLGRPPVAGLVEPGRELERLAADRLGLALVTTEGA